MAHHYVDPVAGDREHHVPDVCTLELGRKRLPLLGRARGEALAQARAVRVGADLPPGLGVDEPQVADGRKLLLARVADLDRDTWWRVSSWTSGSASRAGL